jgi:hypothetical protein
VYSDAEECHKYIDAAIEADSCIKKGRKAWFCYRSRWNDTLRHVNWNGTTLIVIFAIFSSCQWNSTAPPYMVFSALLHMAFKSSLRWYLATLQYMHIVLYATYIRALIQTHTPTLPAICRGLLSGPYQLFIPLQASTQ